MFYLLISKVILYTNTLATVIMHSLVEQPSNWKNKFDNMFQNLLEIKLNLEKIFQNGNVNPLKMVLFSDLAISDWSTFVRQQDLCKKI